jgi:hypothetical protein
LVLAGFPSVADFLRPTMPWLANLGNGISLWWHQSEMARGLVRLQSLAYLTTLIAFCLYLTSVIIRSKRA